MNLKWLCALALALSWATPAVAVGQLADVTVYDRNEQRLLPVYSHQGRYYVAGKTGNEYEVRVRNHTGEDVLAVMSIDGVNAITGETANWNQSGYVLAPYASTHVKGWRKNLERVAAFYFSEHDRSYAARTGRPDNVGVIGVAVFRKQPDAVIGREERSRETPLARPAPSAPAGDSAASAAPEPKKENKLGTGHGRNQASHARHTTFARASSEPAEIIAIHYDTEANLVAQGIVAAPKVVTPFPGQFVPDPH